MNMLFAANSFALTSEDYFAIQFRAAHLVD